MHRCHFRYAQTGKKSYFFNLLLNKVCPVYVGVFIPLAGAYISLQSYHLALDHHQISLNLKESFFKINILKNSIGDCQSSDSSPHYPTLTHCAKGESMCLPH